MRDEIEFNARLGQRYTEFEDDLDDREGDNPTRQLWHTPTELFRPYYGEAIARYLVSNYRLTTYPYDDLLIFEMGAGRGTLMLNILDYIRAVDPQVYARTRFNIIEISPALAEMQEHHLRRTAESRGHADKVEIINKSIFDWDRYVPSPCFFLAMEVFDNFAHDGIRYDVETGEPLQGHVLVDADGDFYEFYLRELDPLAARFFRVRHAATAGDYPRPYPTNPVARYLSSRLPFSANLSQPEYVPTRLLQFFDVLERYFPAHRLLSSDFDSLPQATKGLNAPVVQTRYKRKMVPVSTPLVSPPPVLLAPLSSSAPPFFLKKKESSSAHLSTDGCGDFHPFFSLQVHQGYFDILFPTDFGVTEALYRAVTGKLTRVMSHGDFMKRWAYVEDTQTCSGENPLLSHYRNASVLVTV